ncbi:hypothetical protein DHEL01_v208037 [Diaporthe helianthi]|uniref:Uncharacterized protein n=1 Tax=Diaporthe helianthi TaxID=158607 RepID=A0A2P5HTH4_DIAHE|nr:hypothetical protein DHEL01_v208037 [Diaporthe helianthi]
MDGSEDTTILDQVVCECGGDHRWTDTRDCPVFGILDTLNGHIGRFFAILEAVEFARGGFMSISVRDTMTSEYDDIIKYFKKCQALAQRHPEWHLAKEICRLRKYFDQVAPSVKEEKRLLEWVEDVHLPEIEDGDSRAIQRAKDKTSDSYGVCHDILSPHISAGAEALDLEDPDVRAALEKIDAAFKNAINSILVLPKTENALIQDLAKMSYEIWDDTRRLLCNFEPSQRETAF